MLAEYYLLWASCSALATEAVAQRYYAKNLFPKILQSSKENTYVRVSFFNKINIILNSFVFFVCLVDYFKHVWFILYQISKCTYVKCTLLNIPTCDLEYQGNVRYYHKRLFGLSFLKNINEIFNNSYFKSLTAK